MSSTKRLRDDETRDTSSKRQKADMDANAAAAIGGEKRKRKSRFSSAPADTAPDNGSSTTKASGFSVAEVQAKLAETKARMAALAAAHQAAQSIATSGASSTVPTGATVTDPTDSKKRLVSLQEVIALRLNAALAAAERKPIISAKPAPLLLDKEGRQIDERGNVIKQVVKPVVSLKANLLTQKKSVVNPYLAHRSIQAEDKTDVFDPRLKLKKRETRATKSLSFVSEGTYVKQGEKMRQVEARKVIAGHASGRNPNSHNKEGISAVENEAAEPEEPVIEAVEEEQAKWELPPLPQEKVTDLEWWDAAFLPRDRRNIYNDIFRQYSQVKKSATSLAPVVVASREAGAGLGDGSGKNFVHTELAVENSREWELVQHPPKPRTMTRDKNSEPVLPLYLTKKERKRIRRQTRGEREKEKQDKIALGLMPPPEPKVRLANMMRVLGEQAVADPSQIEAKVREQMAERQMNHEMRNQARKLTPEERKEKKKQKLLADQAGGLHAALFRVKDLSDPKIRFKVDVNAQELYLTGGVLMCKDSDINLVVVEGGNKSVQKFIKLMTKRIDWTGKKYDTGYQDSDDSDEEERPTTSSSESNSCDFVWTGEVIKRAFPNFRFQECRTAATARKVMEAKNVVHYWDMVYTPTISESKTQQELLTW